MKHKVQDVMTRTVAVVPQSAPFKEIVRLMDEHRVSALPVIDADGRLVGIVSEADLLLKEEFSGPQDSPLFARRMRRFQKEKAVGEVASDLMTRKVITVSPNATLAEAARLMHRHGLKRLPVVEDGGKILGIVSRKDLLKVFLRPDEEIRREVVDDILERVLWMEPDTVRVQVGEGRVRLEGQIEQRSTIPVLVGLVRGIDGVVAVEEHLSWQVDDVTNRQPIYPWGAFSPR